MKDYYEYHERREELNRNAAGNSRSGIWLECSECGEMFDKEEIFICDECESIFCEECYPDHQCEPEDTGIDDYEDLDDLDDAEFEARIISSVSPKTVWKVNPSIRKRLGNSMP